jgi:uncharacterized protein YhbP (UPF0306 family)
MKTRPEVLEYLKTQRIGVLAVEMLDGSPHAATVHFAHTEDPFEFYFETYREYRKAEALLGRVISKASFVVGVDEKNLQTLQLDGTVQLLTPEDKDIFDTAYFAKFPNKVEKSDASRDVFFKFIPTWWKFTDWTTPRGKIILSSEAASTGEAE